MWQTTVLSTIIWNVLLETILQSSKNGSTIKPFRSWSRNLFWASVAPQVKKPVFAGVSTLAKTAFAKNTILISVWKKFTNLQEKLYKLVNGTGIEVWYFLHAERKSVGDEFKGIPKCWTKFMFFKRYNNQILLY